MRHQINPSYNGPERIKRVQGKRVNEREKERWRKRGREGEREGERGRGRGRMSIIM